MILHCSFEELTALDKATARALDAANSGGVAAPPEVLPDIEALAHRLGGDLSIDNLDEQSSIERALRFLLAEARERTDGFILEGNPSSEGAIAAYFDYAHILTFADRVNDIGQEMRALIELMTGRPPSEESANRFSFED